MCFRGPGGKRNTIHFLPPPPRPLPRAGFQAPKEPPAPNRRPALGRAPHAPLSGPDRRPRLTADHPAAEDPVAAEQRGAQQQQDHAAHRGTATAAGVAWSESDLCPPHSRGSNPWASPPGATPAARARPLGPLRASPRAGPGAGCARAGCYSTLAECWARAHSPAGAR